MSGPDYAALIEAPTAYQTMLAGRFPGAWKALKRCLAARDELGGWPAHVYCPMAWAAAVAGQQITWIAPLAAVGVWRSTKVVAHLDPDLGRELWQTPVRGQIPEEVLRRLPVWCPYVTLDGVSEEWAGFFVHLEADANTGREELRFVLLPRTPGGAVTEVPLGLHLGYESLDEGLAAFEQEALAQVEHGVGSGVGWRPVQEQLRREMRELIEPLLSITLYLCSEEPDIEGRAPRKDDGDVVSLRAARKKRKKRDAAAQQPDVWEVGWRLGAALRRARQAADAAADDGSAGATETGRRVKPHVRSAHWHTYWTGSRKEGAPPQKPVLRWLSPMLIGAGEDEDREGPVVIRPVPGG